MPMRTDFVRFREVGKNENSKRHGTKQKPMITARPECVAPTSSTAPQASLQEVSPIIDAESKRN
jgi:hypothetical protein